MKRERSKIAGIILAAGYSTRAGAFKPLLPLGNSTIIERAADSFLEAGMEDVCVVVGWRAGELLPVLNRLAVRAVFNPHFEQGMYSSVIAGVTSLNAKIDAFLLLPVDTPLVKPRTVRDLIDCYLHSQAGIVYPRFLGRRGHPPLVAKKYVEDALSPDQPGGLGAVLRRHANDAVDLDVVDQGVVMDVDTPEDYEEVLAYASREGIPTAMECRAVLSKLDLSDEAAAHAQQVANLSRQLADALNDVGFGLNFELVYAAGMLHGLTENRHGSERVRAELLESLGFSRVAGIVAALRDVDSETADVADEAIIVCLADKAVEGHHRDFGDAAFDAFLGRLASRPGALEAVRDCLSGCGHNIK